MFDMLIRGGEVVTPDEVVVADVAIQGETIAAVAAPGTLGGDVGRVIDEPHQGRIAALRFDGFEAI